MASTLVREAVEGDWGYIETLRRRESDALGFVPKDRYLSVIEKRPSYGRDRWRYENVWTTEDNGDTTGFCYASFPVRTGVAKLWQVCVQEDARRWHRALLLVETVERQARERGLHTVEARVAADLEANLFWMAAGYEPVAEERSTYLARSASKCGRMIVLYRKKLQEPAQPQLWEAL